MQKKLWLYQHNWMSEASKATRSSQWRSYISFCEEFGINPPLPASLETILLYVTHLAERLKYRSIKAYLGAVWILHDINGVPHIDPLVFELDMTLKGIRRTLGDLVLQAPPARLGDLLDIYSTLDMRLSEDVAFWLVILLCFRGLLRKSNVVEKGLAVLCDDVQWELWGVSVSVRRTKTICYGERVLFLPFIFIPRSIYCIGYYVSRLACLVPYPSGQSQLVTYVKGGRLVRGSYSWYSKRLTTVCKVLRLPRLTSHSMRRGGASMLAENGVGLLDIRNLGDWRSMSVLLYLTRTKESRVELDRRLSKLFC